MAVFLDFATGMRREEAARLDRVDLDDGWATQAIIRGKGDKERVVFFSEEALCWPARTTWSRT